MEPLTHFLTGAILSRAGLNRTTALATPALVLSAEVADIDFILLPFSRVEYFIHHRGFTHTFLGVPFMAALVVGVLWLWHRWRVSRGRPPTRPVRWGVLFGLACSGALSHILLDFTNNYGVHPLWPFYDRWWSWDIVFIIEPLLLAVLLMALVMPALFALVSEEIGARAGGFRGRGWAIFALIFMVALWGLRDFQHRRALAMLEARLYDDAEPVRISAYSYWIDPFKWYGVVETASSYHGMNVNTLTAEVDYDHLARTWPKPEPSPLLDAARAQRFVRHYLNWADYTIFEVERREWGGPAGIPPDGAAYVVRFFDLRFLYPDHPWRTRDARPLSGYVKFDPDLNLVDQSTGPPPESYQDD